MRRTAREVGRNVGAFAVVGLLVWAAGALGQTAVGGGAGIQGTGAAGGTSPGVITDGGIAGRGDGGQVAFFPGPGHNDITSSPNFVFYPATPYVGIGVGATTPDPGYSPTLEVRKDQAAITRILVSNQSAAANAQRALTLADGTHDFKLSWANNAVVSNLPAGDWGLLQLDDSGTAFFEGMVLNTVQNIPIYFGTANTVAMTIDSSQHVGIGTTTPGADTVKIVAGSIPTGGHALEVTGTAAASGVGRFGVQVSVASNAASTATAFALSSVIGAGASTNQANYAGSYGECDVVSTGSWNPLNGGETGGTDNSGMGLWGESGASGAGTSIAVRGQAFLSAEAIGAVNGVWIAGLSGASVFAANSLDIGSVNFVTGTANAGSTTETHVGVVGQALGGNTNVAGFFGLRSTPPTFTTAALICDNGAVAAPVQIWRDNGTAVWTMIDGGDVHMEGDFNFVPTTDNTGSVGTGANRFKLVRAVTITSGDIGFDDESCPICHKPIEEHDSVILTAKARVYPAEGKSYIPTVPAHLSCLVVDSLKRAVGLE